jgi:hypothetical protein
LPGSAYIVTKNLRATTRPACVVEWLGKYPDGVREIRSPSLTREIAALAPPAAAATNCAAASKISKKKKKKHRQTRKLAKRGTSGTCAVNVGFVHMEKKTKQNKKLGNFGEMFEP